jgi:hypothetical protein
MMPGRPRRMHTVPRGYFRAFTVDEPPRASRLWRFDSVLGGSKLVGVGDTEVVRDIYTVYGEDGTPDTGIEELLQGVEAAFCRTRDRLLRSVPISRDDRTALSRFIAAQLLRTPRFFQLMLDGLTANGIACKNDIPQRVMPALIGFWIPRLIRMDALLAYTDADAPRLLTSDNPAVMWKRTGDGFICGGVDQFDPHLVISCPLSPNLLFVTYQTPRSLEAVHAEHERKKLGPDRVPETFATHVRTGSLPKHEAVLVNQVCSSNADEYVYASYSDGHLLQFLHDHFVGIPAPFRARDFRPIGTPAA